VFFTGDVETVVERTMGRGHFRPRDKFLSPKELLQSRQKTGFEKSTFIAKAKEKNIPVLELDAKDTVKIKSKRIVDFVQGLN
jgi:hypothetical protein